MKNSKTFLKTFGFLFLLLITNSCSEFVTSGEGSKVVKLKSDDFSIIFSGNINGETHPCGCRHFPLGGLPNIAGTMHELRQTKDLLYVDAGDTFFPNATLPAALKDSLTFAAKNLAKGLGKLGLKYFVPGDQDFAAGYDFLKEILDENKILLLVSNLKDPKSFNHQSWVKIQKGPLKVYVTGVVDPTILPTQWQYLFTPVNQGFEKVLKEMKSDGYDEKDNKHRLIVVSNAGMEPDKSFARNYKNIDWILGAHSQSFTNIPFEQGKTQLVQTLSRNHYLGEIHFSFKAEGNKKSNDKFTLHEMREEKGKLLKDNPYYAFIEDHKIKLTKIQEEEQSRFVAKGPANQKRSTAQSCLECHEPQGQKWKSTAHAMAFVTLVNAKQEFNLQCIECHSYGLKQQGGFNTAEELVHSESTQKEKEEKPKNSLYKNYVSQVKQAFGKIKSVRALSSKVLLAQTSKLHEIDDKLNIEHNFSGVQCLNCHSKHPNHPFEKSSNAQISKVARKQAIKESCLNCHDPDQSPEWYKGDKLHEKKFDQVYKKIACPKYEEY